VTIAFTACAQHRQRALRAFAAVDSRRPEKDHGVLDLLLFEAAERLEVLGQNANRTRVPAFEKRLVQVR